MSKGSVKNLDMNKPDSGEPTGMIAFCHSTPPADTNTYVDVYRKCMQEARRYAAGMYWVTGRFLEEMSIRGEKATAKAAIAEEGISERSLEECCQFYKAFPDWEDVDYLSNYLPWSGAREVARLSTPEIREEVMQSLKPGMTVAEVKDVVQKAHHDANPDDNDGRRTKKKKGDEASEPGGDPEPVQPSVFFGKEMVEAINRLEGQLKQAGDIWTDKACEITNYHGVIDDDSRVSQKSFDKILDMQVDACDKIQKTLEMIPILQQALKEAHEKMDRFVKAARSV